MTTRYTDKEFFNDVLDLLETAELPDEKVGAMTAKVMAKLEQLEKRADYSKNHRKPTVSKVSEETKALAAEIEAVLTDAPMTAVEINEALGTDYTALKIAGAVKQIPGVKTEKVIREAVNKAGLKAERQYTAYSLD